jgi:hypothetical protein
LNFSSVLTLSAEKSDFLNLIFESMIYLSEINPKSKFDLISASLKYLLSDPARSTILRKLWHALPFLEVYILI